jgi:hypothetical protein
MLRLVTLTAVLALTACANQGDEGFIVLNNTAVTGSCALSGDPGQPFLSHGEIYSGSPKGYVLTPLIQSRVTSGAGSGASVDPTTRTIFFKGANVTLEVKAVSIQRADGSFGNATVTLTGQQAQFSTLFSGSLPPGATTNVGFELIPVQTLRTIQQASGAGATDHMRAEVLATVTVLGELNGDEISAQPFTFPVSVCNDCVIVNNGACPMIATPRTGNACNIFQDGVVDCCVDAMGFLTCPAPMGTAAN